MGLPESVGQRPGQGYTRADRAAVRVVIAEDSVLLREGLARLLGENGFDVVDTCQTADDLLLKVRSYSPNVHGEDRVEVVGGLLERGLGERDFPRC